MRITELRRERGNRASWAVINDSGAENHRVISRDISDELAEQKRTREPLKKILERRAGYAGDGVEEVSEFHDHDLDYERLGHSHEDIWTGTIGELSADIDYLATRFETHLRIGHDLPELQRLAERIQELETSQRQVEDHEREFRHSGYVTRENLRSGESFLTTKIDDGLSTLKGQLDRAISSLDRDIGNVISVIPEVPVPYDDASIRAELQQLREEIALMNIRQPGEIDRKELAALTAGHDLHVAGKTNVHGRGTEVRYICECGFTIFLPEGVL